jgi:xanthine dehydrogenase accessory factor
MEVWQFIYDKFTAQVNIMLLYVLQSEGSSPGRQGFKMAVAADNSFCGSIGGGIMEHKFVEMAKAILQQDEAQGLFTGRCMINLQPKTRAA